MWVGRPGKGTGTPFGVPHGPPKKLEPCPTQHGEKKKSRCPARGAAVAPLLPGDQARISCEMTNITTLECLAQRRVK